MASFALITEGITDQVVVETILRSFYGDNDIDVNILQPARDQTDKSKQEKNGLQGGFENVLEYCSFSSLEDDLLFNDYVVIQIDSDQSEHSNFDVPQRDINGEKSTIQLIEDIKNNIVSRIQPSIFAKYSNKFLFAIAIHSTECWLLPIFSKTKSDKIKTKNCANTLERLVEKNGVGFQKNYRVYENLSRHFFNKGILQAVSNNQESLKIFIDSLPKAM